jgi:hypothetical protein
MRKLYCTRAFADINSLFELNTHPQIGNLLRLFSTKSIRQRPFLKIPLKWGCCEILPTPIGLIFGPRFVPGEPEFRAAARWNAQKNLTDPESIAILPPT